MHWRALSEVGGGTRPLFYIEESEHPLAQEQTRNQLPAGHGEGVASSASQAMLGRTSS